MKLILVSALTGEQADFSQTRIGPWNYSWRNWQKIQQRERLAQFCIWVRISGFDGRAPDSCYSKCGLRASSITSPGDLLDTLTPKLHSEQVKSRSSADISQDDAITGTTCFASRSLADLQAPFRFEKHWSSLMALQFRQMPWLRGHLGSA